jgi:hypothetical protein
MAEKENVPWLLSCPHEACNLRCGEGRKGGEEVDVVLKYESTPRATRQRDTRCLLVRVKAAALAVLDVSVLHEKGHTLRESNGGELALCCCASFWPRA